MLATFVLGFVQAEYDHHYSLDIEVELNSSVDLLKMEIELNPEIHNIKVLTSELGTFEWWISGLMLDPLFFLISKLTNACSSHIINIQIN